MTDNWYEKFLARHDEFHMVMGYCIAAWAAVDEQLFLLFSDCVGPHEQAAIIYYRTPGLDVRGSIEASRASRWGKDEQRRLHS